MFVTIKKTIPGLLFLLLIISHSLFPENGKRIALVMGNGDYQNAPLDNPVNDAVDVSNVLRELGFQVQSLTNVDRRNMYEGIRDFGDKLERGSEETIGLFYYSGHAVQVNGANYLIPVNNDIRRQDEIPYSAVNVDLILNKMESAGNKTNILILDACRDNPFKVGQRSMKRGLLPVAVQPPGSIIIYSTAPGMTAQDGEGRNGLFTKALLKYIKTPNLDIELMIRYVRDEVIRESKGIQIPWHNSSLSISGFMFVKEEVESLGSIPGRLTVTAKRSSVVFVDGEMRRDLESGETATIEEMLPGRHTVELLYQDGSTEEQEVLIGNNQTADLEFSSEQKKYRLVVEELKLCDGSLDTDELVERSEFGEGDRIRVYAKISGFRHVHKGDKGFLVGVTERAVVMDPEGEKIDSMTGEASKVADYVDINPVFLELQFVINTSALVKKGEYRLYVSFVDDLSQAITVKKLVFTYR